jgi:hypothetical protein
MRTLALWLLVAVMVCADERPKPPPTFAGESLPAPPQQGKPWSLTTGKVSEDWLSATTKLLDYGLADPRGCEYREVELAVGGVTSKAGHVVKTHAFVLPADSDAAQRFSVAWNGLVYPCLSVGEPADLTEDVAAIAARKTIEHQIAMSEFIAVSHQHNEYTKCAMLLVLGRDDLASDLLAAMRGGPAGKDPYMSLVTCWTWFHYDRAICGHLWGEDVIALASARAAAATSAAVEKDAPLRGIVRGRDIDGNPAPYIRFLGNIDVLVRDQQRRVALGPAGKKLDDWQKIEDPAARIKLLIRNLEFIDETQDSQPGGVSLGSSPIIEALTKEGETAVEPLIDCLETDDRLVRSVSFSRDFHTTRYLHSVGDAAYSALTLILKTRTFGPATTHGYQSFHNHKREDVVRELREYWQHAKGLPEMDRAFDVLADDNATERQWLEAATKLVSPVRPTGAPPVPAIVRRLLPPSPPAGAKLATRKSPSVTELLIRRADSVTELDLNSTLRVHHMAAACKLTLLLAQWDPSAARDVIHKRVAQCQALQRDKFYGPYAKTFREPLAQLLAIGLSEKDEAFAAEYATWLGELTPKDVETFEPAIPFVPLGYSPDNPFLVGAAEKAFTSPDSPWLPLHEKTKSGWPEFLASPLVSVPAFQKLLAKELTNTAELGTVSVDIEKKMMNVTIKDARHSGSLANSRDPDLPPDAAPRPLRVCDAYAWHLSRLEGSPLFRPYWPVERKDAAIAQYPEFLAKWGRCFQGYLPLDTATRFRGEPSSFHLFKADGKFLNQSMVTASEDDVASGRAIFSLQDIGTERRAVPLTMFPHIVRWKTLKTFPLSPTVDKDGTQHERFDQNGAVWQAEEVLIDGKWQRFYGFVGKHIIAKVPADEIELLEPSEAWKP